MKNVTPISNSAAHKFRELTDELFKQEKILDAIVQKLEEQHRAINQIINVLKNCGVMGEKKSGPKIVKPGELK